MKKQGLTAIMEQVKRKVRFGSTMIEKERRFPTKRRRLGKTRGRAGR